MNKVTLDKLKLMAASKTFRLCGVEVPSTLVGLAILLLVTTSITLLAVIWIWRHDRPRLPNVNAAATSATNMAPSPGPASADELAEAGFVEIFNGHDLDGWDFDPAAWSVRDGVIHGSRTKRGALFWRGSEVDDFELRFRFRLWDGNSGVHYRARQLTNYAVGGYEVGGYEFEIFNRRTGELSDNGRDRPWRSLFRQDTPEPIDKEWHEGVIIATGTRLIHRLDGQIYCDMEDTDPVAPRQGLIAFGNAVTTVDFKDIRIKRTSRPR